MASALDRCACLLGFHRWSEQRLLEQTYPSGVVLYLEGDVCLRCEKVRDADNKESTLRLFLQNRHPVKEFFGK